MKRNPGKHLRAPFHYSQPFSGGRGCVEGEHLKLLWAESSAAAPSGLSRRSRRGPREPRPAFLASFAAPPRPRPAPPLKGPAPLSAPAPPRPPLPAGQRRHGAGSGAVRGSPQLLPEGLPGAAGPWGAAAVELRGERRPEQGRGAGRAGRASEEPPGQQVRGRWSARGLRPGCPGGAAGGRCEGAGPPRHRGRSRCRRGRRFLLTRGPPGAGESPQRLQGILGLKIYLLLFPLLNYFW